MKSANSTFFLDARRTFHERAFSELIRLSEDANEKKGIPSGVPSFSDKDSKASREIGMRLVDKLGHTPRFGKHKPQTSGSIFEKLVLDFVQTSFQKIAHLRPGRWEVLGKGHIADYEQYAHLRLLSEAAKQNPDLEAILGNDYTIKPDVVVVRRPEPDDGINARERLVDENVTNLASLREANGGSPLLHASISCKYSIRSDRSQNSRSEALNLIRNRKGRVPHIVVVTCEPTPSRLGSIALGTGDIDCVYHFALPELLATINELGYEDAEDSLRVMIQGKRLRDLGDLPLDLAV